MGRGGRREGGGGEGERKMGGGEREERRRGEGRWRSVEGIGERGDET